MEEVRTEFKKLLVAEKVAYLRKIIKSLTNNDALADVYPTVQDLTDVADKIEQLESEVNALKVQRLEKSMALRNARTLAGNLSSLQAESINLIAAGNSEILRSSGMKVFDTNQYGKRNNAEPQPVKKVAGLNVVGIDEDGLVELAWMEVTGATLYVLEYSQAEDDSMPWETFDYSSKATFKGHVSVVRTSEQAYTRPLYYFRVAAIGPIGAGPWSEVVKKYLL